MSPIRAATRSERAVWGTVLALGLCTPACQEPGAEPPRNDNPPAAAPANVMASPRSLAELGVRSWRATGDANSSMIVGIGPDGQAEVLTLRVDQSADMKSVVVTELVGGQARGVWVSTDGQPGGEEARHAMLALNLASEDFRASGQASLPAPKTLTDDPTQVETVPAALTHDTCVGLCIAAAVFCAASAAPPTFGLFCPPAYAACLLNCPDDPTPPNGPVEPPPCARCCDTDANGKCTKCVNGNQQCP
jgi:hypothetical protein